MLLFQATMVAALVVGGMGVALLGSIKAPWARRLQIDEARVGGLIAVFGFAMIPVILSAGFLTDLAGRQVVFLAGYTLLAVSVVAIGAAPSYPLALAAVILFSAAWSLLTNVGNVLTPLAFPGSDPRDNTFATNLANVFFGLGAFLTPLGVPWLVRRTSLPSGLVILGGLALVPALLALPVNLDSIQPKGVAPAEATTDPGIQVLLGDPMMWLFGLGMFCYGPLEASLAGWATTYLGEHGVQEENAARLLSSFWLSYMAARLLTAFMLPAGAGAYLVLALSIACLLLLAFMVMNGNRTLAMAAVPAAGLIFGPIFPTLLGAMLGYFPPSLHGRAVGLFFAMGGIGWSIVPLLIGAYARRAGIRRGLSVALLPAMGLAAIAATLLARR